MKTCLCVNNDSLFGVRHVVLHIRLELRRMSVLDKLYYMING